MTTRVTSLVLANTAVTPGNYGGLTQIPRITVDAQGRITSAANNAVSGISISSGQVTGLAASATTDTTNAANITSGTLPSGRLTGTYAISISGNAATVTNGVYTTGNQTIGGIKTFSSTISGNIDGNAGTVTNGVVTTGSYANPSWITSLAGSKISGNISGNAGNITAYTINQSVGTGNSVQFNAIGVGFGAGATAGSISAASFIQATHHNSTGAAFRSIASSTGVNILQFTNNAGDTQWTSLQAISNFLYATTSFGSTGDITAGYSDERLKDKVGVIENALDKVTQLSGFLYTPNQKAQELGYTFKQEVGVSAQEVQKIQPEAIAQAPGHEEYMTVRYERLVPLLIEAIKELKKEVEELKNSK